MHVPRKRTSVVHVATVVPRIPSFFVQYGRYRSKLFSASNSEMSDCLSRCWLLQVYGLLLVCLGALSHIWALSQSQTLIRN